MKDKIILLVGPTASGKTDMGVRIAKRINAEIISADSMQIYKYMNIGTAKPTKDEMSSVTHHLIDEVEPDFEFSVALFREISEKIIKDIVARGKRPLIVGGTGLYINSLTKPWSFSKTEPNSAVREELEEIVKLNGKNYLHEMLRQIDPISAESIHPNNVKRVIRAIEVYKTSGKTKSIADRESMEEELAFEPILLGLNMERSTLYSRIEQRVDRMIKEGLVEEVDGLLKAGYKESIISMQGLGYKEIVRFLKGEYTLERAIEVLKRDTRHFAKRQLTWFRRDDRIQWFQIDKYKDKDELEDHMISYLESKGII